MSGIAGFRSLVANIGVKDDSLDYSVVIGPEDCEVAGVFTKSLFAGPSVGWSRKVINSGAARGLVVVSKNANVANGAQGERHVEALATVTGSTFGVDADQLVVASTGVIGRPYPMERMEANIAQCGPLEEPADFGQVATAIMTTDTHAKCVTVPVGNGTLVGIAKGVGMIEPDMATMLAFFFSDVCPDGASLDQVFREVVAVTFNALSIDTDTSTSDSAVIFAHDSAGTVSRAVFAEALREVATQLVMMIAGDGEGATTTILSRVSGAADSAQAKLVAKSIVNSPLVKTAVHGADPNWGRVAMAVGKCWEYGDIDPEVLTIDIGGVRLYPQEQQRPDALSMAADRMSEDVVEILVDLGIGDATFTAYGCDLTDGYVRINADYTT